MWKNGHVEYKDKNFNAKLAINFDDCLKGVEKNRKGIYEGTWYELQQ